MLNKQKYASQILKNFNMTPKTFSEIYREISNVTPKQEWIRRISEVTLQPETTVRMWLIDKRGQRPSILAQREISKELGVPVKELFPPKNK